MRWPGPRMIPVSHHTIASHLRSRPRALGSISEETDLGDLEEEAPEGFPGPLPGPIGTLAS
eukprot:980193-Pyramimonas_sp.AAC.1